MGVRPFRFGVSLHHNCGAEEWAKKCRRAEELGYDVILIPDHLHMPAPFPSIVAAASATERVMFGTFVLNAAFWNPRLLEREIATTHRLTGGRLEVGVGTGYAKAEFDEAEIPFESPGRRVRQLDTVVQRLTASFADPAQWSDCTSAPRLMIGGSGDKVLGIAARHADIVGLSPVVRVDTPEKWRALPAETVEERARYLRTQAGDRYDDIEVNLMIPAVVLADDRQAAAAFAQQTRTPYLTLEQVLDAPAGLIGTPEEIADQLVQRRERYGVSYITVHEEFMEPLAAAMAVLEGRPS
ncbi:TIGR03621 family F420-dependent LLM class oxidoreductase [Micromonospora sp. CA-240977]|uniref:TIGR03621 family F420-dependent LLM class oxidoreductase n=1 Tax=Micromonospora sp. CA-240977 TaxID=3239957 RepID=UPI003D94516D